MRVYISMGDQNDSFHFIEQIIYLIRGRRVVLSTDLARLYRVQPKVLVQAVKRNIERFPADFMFQLSREEFSNLKSQIVTSSWGGPRRAFPYAFTEEGVAMLSSVLRSSLAIQVNIGIMRVFVNLREALSMHKELAEQLHRLESRIEGHDGEIKTIFDAIHQIMAPPDEPPPQIGFRPD